MNNIRFFSLFSSPRFLSLHIEQSLKLNWLHSLFFPIKIILKFVHFNDRGIPVRFKRRAVNCGKLFYQTYFRLTRKCFRCKWSWRFITKVPKQSPRDKNNFLGLYIFTIWCGFWHFSKHLSTICRKLLYFTCYFFGQRSAEKRSVIQSFVFVCFFYVTFYHVFVNNLYLFIMS